MSPPIPKGPPSSSVGNSITSVLSEVSERLVSVRLGRFMERNGVLPTTQFPNRKSLGICVTLLCLSNTLKSALVSWQEVRIVQIDFSAAFDGLTIRAFSIGSALWVVEILCCLY